MGDPQVPVPFPVLRDIVWQGIESVNSHLIQISAEKTPENNASARDRFLLRIRAVWSTHSDTGRGIAETAFHHDCPSEPQAPKSLSFF